VLGLFWDLGIFVLLYRVFHTNYLFANFAAMIIAICHNFLLNAFFNFKKTDGILKRFLSFLSIGLVGIAVSETIMFLLHDKLGYPAEFVKLGSLPLIAIGQYLLNKKISFKAK
jgi:putative flippase GtrA